jgi:PPE-repeat protein
MPDVVPVWMAVPPEVHSALLSSGPGSGPLLQAAVAWKALGAEYATAAGELGELVAAAAGVWEGSGADSYVAATVPYAAWLRQASATSAAAAAQHEAAAAAYTVALEAMPTPAELAANHATHATLVATNFFGVNTVPLAVNEADYARMWTQAAATMSTYQAASAAAVTATPPTAAAPPMLKSEAASRSNPLDGLLKALEPILKSLGIQDSAVAHDPTVSNALTTYVAHVLQNFGVDWKPAAGTLNGHVYDFYADASQPIWYLARSLELFENFLHFSQDPTQALQYVAALALFDWPTHIAQFATTLSQSPQLLVAVAGIAVAPAGTASGLAGLAGLGGLDGLGDLPQPVDAPVAAADPGWPPPGGISAAPAATAAPTPTPTSAAATTATAAGPAPTPPPPTGGAGFIPPYAVAPPGIGFGTGMSASASAGAKKKAPEPDSAAAAQTSQASTQHRARARRRRRAPLPDPGDEFIGMRGAVEDMPATAASDHGAGPVGLAGTTRKDVGAQAAGLATRPGGRLDDDPSMPLLPGTWR